MQFFEALNNRVIALILKRSDAAEVLLTQGAKSSNGETKAMRFHRLQRPCTLPPHHMNTSRALVRLILIGAAWLPLPQTGQAATCRMRPLLIEPVSNGGAGQFAGSLNAMRVSFQSERPGTEVSEFPEPPVVIQDLRTQRSCQISDGGIWSRQGAHLSSNRRILMLHEYSGSSDTLNFYDTRTCNRLRVVDVSGQTWSVQGQHITLVAQEGGRPRTRRVSLGQACLPPQSPR